MARSIFSLAATAKAMQNLIANSPAGIELALEAIGRSMVNDAKINGKYNDVTGNLRDSIDMVVMRREVSKHVQTLDGGFTISKRGREDIILIVFAGMEYGIAVELRDNKDVLGGTVKKWIPRISKILGEDIKTRGTYQRGFEKGKN